MAGQSVENIPLSAISPQYLHANSTSHTWAFGAFAELIDNAYDPDVSAKQQWIDLTRIKDEDCLIFMDNGAGLDYDKMLKMMSFGYSDKKTIRGHAPVGLYGNGFKSGAMRLGKDAIVFSKTRDTMSVGLLSQTYLAAIQAQHIAVPIVTYRQDGEGKFSVEPGHADCLTAILQHSLFQNEEELLQELNAINNMPPVVSTGTRIIIWNLRRPNGQLEFDLQTSRYDIQIPRVDSGADQDPRKDLEPESSYSLRAYCSILYLKPRMQIIIRGLKVRTQLVSKSLAHTLKDRYTPQFLRRPIIITFGYNPKTSAHYGIMMYHKKRLIRAYEHVGCQRQAKPKGVGIIGIIECDFLKPTHNKQDFDASEEYRKVKSKLGEKLEEYWNQMRHMKLKKDPKCTLAVEDMERSPDQNWVQCNTCQKWRKLPDGINASRLPDEWFCFQNPDPQYRSCQIEEELEDSEDEQPYQKTYRQAISWEMRQQLENRQQNAAGAVSTLSTYATPSTSSGTNRGISGATAGGDVTRLTTPPSTPLSRSGCRPSARNTPRIPSILSTPTHPRSRRLLLSPESEPVKRAKVKDHSLLPMAQETEEAISPQLCDGALAEESMDTSGTATAATPPSAVHQQVSVSTQTGGVAKVEEGTEEITRSLGKEEPMSSEEIQLPNGETRELADSSHQMKLFLDLQRDRQLEQLEITMKERDHYKEQMETASQERDRYRCQVEAANQERDQYQERMEAASQERDCYRSKVEAANQERDQYMEQVNKLYQELQQMRSGSVKLEQSDQAPGGNEDPILLLDSVLRDLDSCNEEREQLKSKLESVEAERGAVISQCEELKTELGNLRRELEDLREAGTRAISHSPSEGTGNGPTTPGSAETERLRTLRVSVSRLLVILIPSLELDQVDYNSTVIDEILEQYLDGISSEAM